MSVSTKTERCRSRTIADRTLVDMLVDIGRKSDGMRVSLIVRLYEDVVGAGPNSESCFSESGEPEASIVVTIGMARESSVGVGGLIVVW